MKKKMSLVMLSEKEVRKVLAGLAEDGASGPCQCGCYYEGEPGGSSTLDNGVANAEHGWHSIERDSVE